MNQSGTVNLGNKNTSYQAKQMTINYNSCKWIIKHRDSVRTA